MLSYAPWKPLIDPEYLTWAKLEPRRYRAEIHFDDLTTPIIEGLTNAIMKKYPYDSHAHRN